MADPALSGGTEPIAVVGIGCRFAPDLNSPGKFWSYLLEERSTAGEMPSKRWEPYERSNPETGGILRKATRRGSFLDDIEGFDAAFFGIAPREATYMDPQQRMLLEVTWEALEHSGIAPVQLRGGDVGVFMAGNSFDYGHRMLADVPRITGWTLMGGMLFALANRISYVLDFQGPSIVVDAACAGSLASFHLACQSLRNGECSLAITGGVNVMCSPGALVGLDAAGATSADGRCKTFDKAANGYGRGEGAAVVVLKRLAGAVADGDRILSVVLGSGVFQDGRTGGMWAPNPVAQEHMMREVCRRSGVSPSSVDYVEAHGTGTPVGDLAEAQAVSAVYGRGRPTEESCLIGSIKPNIGHLEAGAGVAGVVKTVLSLHHGRIPASLHTELNPEIPWSRSGLRVVPTEQPWPDRPHPSRAAVSSYGMGGTIAHAVLEQFTQSRSTGGLVRPGPAVAHPQLGPCRVLPLSSHSGPALRSGATDLAAWLEEHPDTCLDRLGYTLARRRSHLNTRAAVVAADTGALIDLLHQIAAGDTAADIATSVTMFDSGTHSVWVFSGHGAQWSGMGRGLLELPVFAAVLDMIEPAFVEELGFSPRAAIAEGEWTMASRVQAMTFAIQVGLAAVWEACGVRPAAVIGHSVGEIAAGVTAGALDITEAARFACRRAALIQRQSERIRGGMALVGVPPGEAATLLADYPSLEVAVHTSAASTVMSGETDVLSSAVAGWRARGLVVRELATDVAFHSRHMESILDDLATAAAELSYREPKVPLYTTALADPRTTATRDTSYWVTNLRHPVRFTEAIQAAVEDGHRVFLEVSSHPVVAHSINETLEDLAVQPAATCLTLRRNQPEVRTLLQGLAELHCLGVDVDWSRHFGEQALLELPTRAWQHQNYWIANPPRGATCSGLHAPHSHTLLGAKSIVGGAAPQTVWDTCLDFSGRPYPGSHRVFGVEIVPAGVLFNTMFAAGNGDGSRPTLTDIDLRVPITLTNPRVVQVLRTDDRLQISSTLASESEDLDPQSSWIVHTTASVGSAPEAGSHRIESYARIRARCPKELAWAEFERVLVARGVDGSGFDCTVKEVFQGDGELVGKVSFADDESTDGARSWAEVLDGALALVPLLMPDDKLRMPAHIEALAVHAQPPSRVQIHARVTSDSPDGANVDAWIADEHGQVVADVRGLLFAPAQASLSTVTDAHELVHELVWRPAESAREALAMPQSVAFVGNCDQALVDLVEQAAGEFGVPCLRLATLDETDRLTRSGTGVVIVAPTAIEPGEALEDAAERATWSLVRTAQRVLAVNLAVAAEQGPSPAWRLWCVTRGVRDAEDEAALAHAPLWGAARIIAGEHPIMWGGTADLATDAPDAGRRLLAAVADATGEDVIALTGDGDLVPRLLAVERGTEAVESPLPADATYLITGGLGVLGLEAARWLVGRGARHLVVVGRRPVPPRSEWSTVTDPGVRKRIEALQALEKLGAATRVLALDVADAPALTGALEGELRDLPPIRGVVHAAGVVADAVLEDTNRELLAQTMRPKVRGTLALHRLFPPGSLDFFVLFSSAGHFARLRGQVNYAAANSFLDVLAEYRRADALSIGWVSWRNMGQSKNLVGALMEANAAGFDAISAHEALASWTLAESFGGHHAVVLRPLAGPPGMTRLPVLSELSANESDAAASMTRTLPIDEWRALHPNEFRKRITDDLLLQVSDVTGTPVADISHKRVLYDLGLDSLMIVTLRLGLQQRYSTPIPPGLLWDNPTITTIVDHLIEQIESHT